MPSITLTVEPTSGTAPFTVDATATVIGPFQGYVALFIVDVTYANPHRNESSRLYVKNILASEGSTGVQFLGIQAGTSGHTYNFYGYLESEFGQQVAAAEPVAVTVY